MATINIYLTFNGNCREVFDFYKSVFGGEYDYISTFGEMPRDENTPTLSEIDATRIMHVSLPISKETYLMASDITENYASGFKEGNNFSISIDVESKTEADRLFNALSAGGQITMPMNQTFWGAYFGMFTDKFGINWMINFDEK